MAKLERTSSRNMDELLVVIENEIIEGSVSATLEDGSSFHSDHARCEVRVFERYSYMGNNRVSMNVTLFQADNGPVEISAITSGGSQAVFWKINTIGEESFLEALEEILDEYA